MTMHVVQFSTGLGSAEVARRVVAEHGVDNVHLLTADTLVEDPDNWRFANQAHEFLGAPQWTVLTDGRTPMEVGRDERVVPNNRFAVCSRVLKRDLLRKHIDATYDPADTVICLGFDWSEGHRLDAATPHWAPYEVDAPLMRKPWSAKWDLIRQWRDFGIEPPRLYEQGFGHANCFAPETRFITDRGVKTLEETVGTTVRVLGKGGGWKDAEVRSFGEQPLTKVELNRYSDTKTIFVTADHQWPVRKAAGRTDFRMKTTADLVPGQRIASMYARPLSTPRPADWQVVSVEATDRRSEVMCAVVEDGHMFTLEDNVYTHNCGGACVRGGQAQWELLLQVNRATYVEWEGEEQKTRDLLGKDVSILRDRRGGTVTPLTLRTFRERLEQDATLFDSDDWGACGCT